MASRRTRGSNTLCRSFSDLNGTDILFELMGELLSLRRETQFVVAGGLPENRRAERRWLARWERDSRLNHERTGRIRGLAKSRRPV
jgi:hypothetical protein